MKSSSPYAALVQLYLSLVSLPILGGLVMLDWISHHFLHWSVWSEELFRGERLPNLPFPTPDQSSQKS